MKKTESIRTALYPEGKQRKPDTKILKFVM